MVHKTKFGKPATLCDSFSPHDEVFPNDDSIYNSLNGEDSSSDRILRHEGTCESCPWSTDYDDQHVNSIREYHHDNKEMSSAGEFCSVGKSTVDNSTQRSDHSEQEIDGKN